MKSNSKGKGRYGTGKYDTDWKRFPNPKDRLAFRILEGERRISPEVSAAIYGMVNQLPPAEKEVIQLRVFELLSYREVARRKGWYWNNVAFLEAQAIQRMREWTATQLPDL